MLHKTIYLLLTAPLKIGVRFWAWVPAAIAAGAAIYEGEKNREANAEASEEAFDQSREGVILGNKLDDRSYRRRDQYDWQRAKSRGLTPQEFYGSAASGGSSTSGSGGTLGNQAGNITMQEAAMNQENRLRTQQQMIDAGVTLRGQDVELEKAKVGAEATKSAAQTSAEASISVAQMTTQTQEAIAARNWKLAYKRYLEVELPKFKQEMKISEQEYNKLVNEVATTDKAFVTYMKKLSMGVDNMMVEYFQAIYGFDITKPDEVRALPEHKRKKFLKEVMAFQSTSLKEFQGAVTGITGAMNDFGTGVSQGVQNIGNYFKDLMPESVNLGNGSNKVRKGGRVSHLPGPQ